MPGACGDERAPRVRIAGDEGVAHVVAHFERARPDARAEEREQLAPAAQRIARTVLSITPAASPRHPACATATARARAVGEQHRQAVGDEDRAHVPAFARDRRVGFGHRRRRIGIDHAVAVHLLQPRGSCGSSARRRARFAATAAGSSPVRKPRLKLAYGPRSTPPARVVIERAHVAGRGPVGNDPVGVGDHASDGVMGDR